VSELIESSFCACSPTPKQDGLLWWRAYLIFLAVALLQFGLIDWVTHTRVVAAGAAFYALLLWRLARGGPSCGCCFLPGMSSLRSRC
jgi:hypothetical protein